MQVPSVVIVGRPNVGKSSLFNALYGSRVAIVEPTAGVTRDRVSRVVERDTTAFELVDTGGIGVEEELAEHVEMQIRIAIEQADLVLLVVDARAGVQPLDRQIANDLRQAGKEMLLVVNKCDTLDHQAEAADFYELGLPELHLTSATQGRGILDLLDRIGQVLPEVEPVERTEPMKIAFVGRRNVGKSTLVNTLAQEPRVVTSELPGTTRDSVDVRFRIGEVEFIAIDTAGIRRRKQIKDSIDFYSTARSFSSIRRADVAVLMLEAPTEIARVDKQLAAKIAEEYTPCVLALNKMDLAGGTSFEEWQQYVRDRLAGVAFAPLVFLSALTGEGALRVVEAAQALHDQSQVRVGTGELNRAMEEITNRNPPPYSAQRFTKIYYATQVGVKPPTIALFTNYPDMIDENYKRYLGNQLRQSFPYTSIPIKFVVRGRQRAEAEG